MVKMSKNDSKTSKNEHWNIIFEPKESEVITSIKSTSPSHTIYEVTTNL